MPAIFAVQAPLVCEPRASVMLVHAPSTFTRAAVGAAASYQFAQTSTLAA
jgi:hypothetical protein